MGPIKNKPTHNKSFKWNLNELKKYCNAEYITKLIFDPQHIGLTCILLFIFEVALNIFIIEKVKYTEIDWVAYMQEVEGFLNGTLDYKLLKGDTGPLVYPAGFVYIFSLLYYITSYGKNIYLAQYIFFFLYLFQTVAFYNIIRKTSKIPPYALIITTLTSYRIHSIYVLRLFNDPIAVLLFYISLNCFIYNRWKLGSVFYSLAVSVKMNILLYAPALLIAYLTNLSYLDTLVNLSICAIIQLVLGLPFLYVNFWSYIKGSFDLGRIFEHKWTVNYRFLPVELFELRTFHIALIILHVSLLLLFTPSFNRYLKSYAKLRVITDDLRKEFVKERNIRKKENSKLSKIQKEFLKDFENQFRARSTSAPKSELDDKTKLDNNMHKITQLFVLPFFVCNLIGIICARSLHYQFYSWYYHSLLYLAFSTSYKSKPFIFLILGLIEYCWNVYPSTNFSSVILHVCHIVLLIGLYKKMRQ